MYSRCVLWVLLAGSARGVSAQQGSSPPPVTSEISTSAAATLTLPPNLATISIEFTARGRSPRDAGRAAAERATAIRRALIAIGIPKDSLPTGERWGWWGNRVDMQVDRTGRDTSYVSTDVMTARIRDLTLVGRAIDTALVERAQLISNVQFAATDPERETVMALRSATQRASARAEAIAEAAGGTLGRTIELTTERRGGYRDYEGYSFDLRGAGVEGGAVSTTVVAPQITVTVTVYGRWEFRPTR